MYRVTTTNKFDRDLKKCVKQGKDISLIEDVVLCLSKGALLPDRYKDHILKGNWKGFRECHVQPDWLLIYFVNEDQKQIVLTRTGSHSELF